MCQHSPYTSFAVLDLLCHDDLRWAPAGVLWMVCVWTLFSFGLPPTRRLTSAHMGCLCSKLNLRYNVHNISATLSSWMHYLIKFFCIIIFIHARKVHKFGLVSSLLQSSNWRMEKLHEEPFSCSAVKGVCCYGRAEGWRDVLFSLIILSGLNHRLGWDQACKYYWTVVWEGWVFLELFDRSVLCGRVV